MIYVDASRYNNTKERTGVENYSYFLINELIEQSPDQITLISPKKVDKNVPQITIPFRRLWTQLRLSFEVMKNKKIDNLFVPSHLMPLIHPKNTTITIHDVAFKRTPKSYGKTSRAYLDWGAKFAVKNAKKIIVPSETTKKDLIKFYNANAKKISVIPLGYVRQNSSERAIGKSRPLANHNLKPHSYFLYIGRLETKKNTDTLIKSFKEFSKNHPNIKLVLAGKPGVGSEEILKLADHPNIITTGYISDEGKDVLLKNCLAFVFPSRFEGFGLPLLEAMAANVPIIASKIPTSYQIAKNNALFFQPEDSKKLAELMSEVMNENTREQLINNHSETLKKYSWKQAAKQTLEVLKK